MIAADQPTIFPQNVRIGLSSINDGSMKDGVELMTPSAIQHRNAFLAQLDMPVEKAAIFAASFDTDNYCRYKLATPSIVTYGIDAVATDVTQQPILVPLADCTCAVLYDPTHHALMVSHLGRHSTEQFGAVKSVAYMTQQFGTSPADVLVWLSPSPNGQDYPLWAFDNRSFIDVLTEQFQKAGVLTKNIEASGIDTVNSPHYFSHSEFLKGHREVDGRYAIAAMLI